MFKIICKVMGLLILGTICLPFVIVGAMFIAPFFLIAYTVKAVRGDELSNRDITILIISGLLTIGLIATYFL